MRDLVVFLFFLSILPLALSNAFVAFLLWTWAGLVAINSYLYGFMAAIPMVQIFAVVTLALVMIPSMRVGMVYRSSGVVIIFLLIVIHGLFSATFAYPGLPHNWIIYTNMVKTILLCMFMPFFITNRHRVNIYVMLVAGAVCFHGLLDGLKFIASGGGHNAYGIPKFGDNNHYALVLLMTVPLLLYVFRYASAKIVKLAALGAFFLTFFAVLATDSRGALLTLMAMGLWLILLSKHKIMGLVIAAVLVTLTMQFAPAEWFDRMDTIKTADEDRSFMGRVTAWKRASAIALENPVLGGGFHAGQGVSIYEQFRYKQGLLGFVDTPDTGYAAATHSIYFEVMGDLGFVGFLLFMAALASVFYNRRRILRRVSADPARLEWAGDLANFIAAGMVAYMVGGAALSAAYFELPYYLIMLMQVLWHVVDQPQEDLSSEKVQGSAHA